MQPPAFHALNIWGACIPTRKEREAGSDYLAKHLEEGGMHVLAGDWNATVFEKNRKALLDISEDADLALAGNLVCCTNCLHKEYSFYRVTA